MEFSIRKLSFIELTQVRLNAIIASGQGDIRPGSADDEKKTLAMIAVANRMQLDVVRYAVGTVTPKIVFAEEHGEPVPDGLIDASWIAGDLDWITEEVLSFSGFNDETSKRVEDLAKNDQSLASSTESQGDTGDSLTKS